MSGFDVVLAHCMADFDALDGAVGSAKLWSYSPQGSGVKDGDGEFSPSKRSTPSHTQLSPPPQTFIPHKLS
eukprot:15352315-Ditylum_brightwellii.AAC.1